MSESHIPFQSNETVGESEDPTVDPTDTGEDVNIEGVDVIRNCLCMRCGEGHGVTRMLIHKIPFFRELVIASFRCPDCYEINNEVSFGGSIQPTGQRQTLTVTTSADLDRQLIKSDSAILRIEEIDFEIPASTQKGAINTLEGFLRTAAKDLALYQAERLVQDPEVGAKVAEIISSLSFMASGEMLPFQVTLDDPAGNSFIQNPSAPAKDPHLQISFYQRTTEQDAALGLNHGGSAFTDDKDTNFTALLSHQFGDVATPEPVIESQQVSAKLNPNDPFKGADGNWEGTANGMLGRAEAVMIPSACPNCLVEGTARTAVTNIPHFKEVLIMAFTCNFCGFRNNEVKAGGAVPERGTEVRLIVEGPDDLKRDILKSDTSMVAIPELELELQHGTLGGVYTTVEGLLRKIHSSLSDDNPFAMGDSYTLHHSASAEVIETQSKFQTFLNKLDSLACGQNFPFTLIIRDPLGNSFISAPLGSFLPPEMDKNLSMEDFDRSFDENEEFGLNDINTKDYESGVDAATYYGHIQPDRITHVMPKGSDHPTFYAKGVEDSTPGGAFVPHHEHINDTNVSNSTPSAEDYYTGPEGWNFSKASGDRFLEKPFELEIAPAIGGDYQKRVFNENDMKLKFMPYENFSGRREGFVYRMGGQGLGYYEDKPPVIIKVSSENDLKPVDKTEI